ncbi:MAG: response regulator [Oscillospiraceae bacterium]|jgi:signal transduction histidine kinase/CheY-like chemotaxis protein|nr:response regulator [Oscillospiraceae bacterium]
MRVRIILVFLAVVVLITVTTTGMNIYFGEDSLRATIENDLLSILEIADRLVAREMALVKANANAIAEHLAQVPQAQVRNAMQERLPFYPRFIALTLIDANGIVAAYGDAPLPPDLLGSEYIRQAFEGNSVISTTRHDPTGQLVIHVCVPVGNTGRVLVTTMRGMVFSELFTNFHVWKTGYIIVMDEEGTVIADGREKFVTNRQNFIQLAKQYPENAEYVALAAFTERMIHQETGTETLSVEGRVHLHIFRPISESRMGWPIAVAVPPDESPASKMREGLLLAALIFLVLGVALALLASRLMMQPFKKIHEQNVELEHLNVMARNASETKSRFLANTSHEMRTPLNAVIGLSQLILDTDEVQGENGENLKKIYNAGAMLLHIVNDLLDISKIESGKLELIPSAYDLASLINDTATLNATHIDEKPIAFCLDISEDLPHLLYGDEQRIKQICNNLLSNAFKYTREGTVTWGIACQRDGDTVWLTISVRDTGIGIRSEDIQKLFTDYNQVDTRTNRAVRGTGLGLAITKRMTEMMDGTVTVESEYGKGSTFTVRLRQGFVDDDTIGHEECENLKAFRFIDHRRECNTRLARLYLPYARVLIVDDVQTNVDVARGMMKPYGMQIDGVTSGQQAIDCIRRGEPKYSAVFMDHMMPEMDGMEATRIIRQEIGTDYARTLPIIALTANAIMGNDKLFLQNGFQAFLSKPIDVMRLDAVLRAFVRDKALEEKLGVQLSADGGAEGMERRSGMERRTGQDRRAGMDEGEQDAADAPALPDIPGLDITRALNRFGGNKESLWSVLRSYAVNTLPLLDTLAESEPASLADYAVVAHGLKGSSYGVCADGVGKSAEAMERAAKANDAAFVRTHAPGLVAAARALVAAIQAALAGQDASALKPRKDAPDADALARLRQACDAYDMDGVDAVMAELEAFAYNDDELMTWLRARVDHMDLAQIVERLSAL